MQTMFGEEENAFEAEESGTDLNSKIEEIQPLLEKIAELKATYKNSPNAKKNSLKQEFETTKERLIDLQSEINEIVSDMTIETNAISFLKEKYPKYVSSLESLKVIDKNNSTESVEGEEEMGAGMSNNNNAMNVNNNNANTVVNNSNKNTNANSVVNLNSNKNSRVENLNASNNTKSNNANNNTKTNNANNNTKTNNATPNTKTNNTKTNNTKTNNATKTNNVTKNDPTPKPPSNNNTRRNLSGGKRRKNKSRKGDKRR